MSAVRARLWRMARRLPRPARRALLATRDRLRPPPPEPRRVTDSPNERPVEELTRTLTMTLPPSPVGGTDPGSIVISSSAAMYVPRTLSKVGLARYEPFGLDCFLAMVDLAPEGAVFDIGANIGSRCRSPDPWRGGDRDFPARAARHAESVRSAYRSSGRARWRKSTPAFS